MFMQVLFSESFEGLPMNSVEREATYLFHTYKRLPLEIERGEGVYLYTKDGKRYLDMFAGLAVNALGYGHPAVLRAIQEQSHRYLHLSNYFFQDPQLDLAERLIRHSGYRKLFLTNSGTESIEGAIKLARRWGSARGKTGLLSFSNAFHGRTMGALSLMDKPKYREGYGPFLPHCSVAAFNDVDQLRRSVSADTAAVVLECIQGEGGIVPVTAEFASELSALQKKHGFLVVADEIQAGIGRTGRFFGFQHFGLSPDIVVVAKPIGGGLPLGGILGSETVADVFDIGVHGTTFGGNPVACAAGCAVIDEVMNNGLMENARMMGDLLMKKLRELQERYPALVKTVRGHGLMVGMELTQECDSVVAALRARGILLNCTSVNVLRFLPPLIIAEEQIQTTVDALSEIFSTR